MEGINRYAHSVDSLVYFSKTILGTNSSIRFVNDLIKTIGEAANTGFV
jgi:hypothetical protein